MKKGADSTCKVMSTSALQQVFRAVFFSKLTYIYATLAWRGFTTSTDRQGIDAVLRRANKSVFWTSVVPSDFPTFEDLCSTAVDELLTKTSIIHTVHSRTTYQAYMHFSHHDSAHHNDTASDGVHTPFSSVDTPPVFLIVISLLVCFIKTAIRLIFDVRLA